MGNEKEDGSEIDGRGKLKGNSKDQQSTCEEAHRHLIIQDTHPHSLGSLRDLLRVAHFFEHLQVHLRHSAQSLEGFTQYATR